MHLDGDDERTRIHPPEAPPGRPTPRKDMAARNNYERLPARQAEGLDADARMRKAGHPTGRGREPSQVAEGPQERHA